jgi:spore germination protein YaaH
MAYWTPEGIAEKTDHLDGISNIKAINKIFRVQDESHLYPINRRFNVTERAIRKARKLQKNNGAVYGLEYCYLLDTLISEIINNY